MNDRHTCQQGSANYSRKKANVHKGQQKEHDLSRLNLQEN